MARTMLNIQRMTKRDRRRLVAYYRSQERLARGDCNDFKRITLTTIYDFLTWLDGLEGPPMTEEAAKFAHRVSCTRCASVFAKRMLESRYAGSEASTPRHLEELGRAKPCRTTHSALFRGFERLKQSMRKLGIQVIARTAEFAVSQHTVIEIQRAGHWARAINRLLDKKGTSFAIKKSRSLKPPAKTVNITDIVKLEYRENWMDGSGPPPLVIGRKYGRRGRGKRALQLS